MKFRSPAVLMAFGVAATLSLTLVVVMALWRTGGAGTVSDNAALIGALVALGGVFTAQMVGIALDDRRTQEARDLEAQRAREAALQNYFEVVGELLIEKPLRRASPGDNLSTVVRAQTLSVFEGLDPDRKRTLLLFLYESGLIYKRKLVVRLVAANLSRANLSEASLSSANLSYANLSGANLSDANLSFAHLGYAHLSGADLSNTDLSYADLSYADLKGADLSGAKLREAILDEVDLIGYTGLRVNLSGADLSKAYLIGAKGPTDEQLEQAKSLKGATMPNRQKYEDWLRDRESREEGG